jgi:hypothetical protein
LGIALGLDLARLAHRLREALAVEPGHEVRQTLEVILNSTVPSPSPGFRSCGVGW